LKLVVLHLLSSAVAVVVDLQVVLRFLNLVDQPL
jgi:hypothetical protein